MKTIKILTYFLLSTIINPLSAQDSAPLPAEEEKGGKCVEASIGVDLVNQYIWRGQDLGDVSLQPTLGISWKGLSLSTWGSVGISDFSDDKELDFTLAYTIKGFNVGITDYWFSNGPRHESRVRGQRWLRLRLSQFAVVHEFRRQRRHQRW